MNPGGSHLDGLDPERWRAAVIEVVSNALREKFPETKKDEPVDQRLERTVLQFMNSGTLPRSSAHATVEDLEESILNLTASQSALLASKIFPLLLNTETRLRIAYQFDGTFVEWIVRHVQPLIGDEIIASVRDQICFLGTPKRRLFLLKMAVLLAPDLPKARVNAEIRQEAKSAFGATDGYIELD